MREEAQKQPIPTAGRARSKSLSRRALPPSLGTTGIRRVWSPAPSDAQVGPVALSGERTHFPGRLLTAIRQLSVFARRDPVVRPMSPVSRLVSRPNYVGEQLRALPGCGTMD